MLSNLMYLTFVGQDNNVIEQILIFGHRRGRDLVSGLLRLMSL